MALRGAPKLRIAAPGASDANTILKGWKRTCLRCHPDKHMRALNEGEMGAIVAAKPWGLVTRDGRRGRNRRSSRTTPDPWEAPSATAFVEAIACAADAELSGTRCPGTAPGGGAPGTPSSGSLGPPSAWGNPSSPFGCPGGPLRIRAQKAHVCSVTARAPHRLGNRRWGIKGWGDWGAGSHCQRLGFHWQGGLGLPRGSAGKRARHGGCWGVRVLFPLALFFGCVCVCVCFSTG